MFIRVFYIVAGLLGDIGMSGIRMSIYSVLSCGTIPFTYLGVAMFLSIVLLALPFFRVNVSRLDCIDV